MKQRKRVEIRYLWPMNSIEEWLSLIAILLGMCGVGVAVIIFARPLLVPFLVLAPAIVVLILVLFLTRGTDPETRRQGLIIILPVLILSSVGQMFRNPWITNLGIGVFVVTVVWYCFLRLPPFYRAAFNQLKIKNFDHALQLANRSIQTRPDSADAYRLRSTIHYFQMQLAEAEQDARDAVKLQPKSFSNWSALGIALLMQGRYVEAKKAYKEALRLAPGYAICYYSVGYACYRLGEYAEARDALTASSRARLPTVESDLLAHYFLGCSLIALNSSLQANDVHRKMSRFSKGLAKLSEWLNDKPDFPEIVQLRADLADIERRLA